MTRSICDENTLLGHLVVPTCPYIKASRSPPPPSHPPPPTPSCPFRPQAPSHSGPFCSCSCRLRLRVNTYAHARAIHAHIRTYTYKTLTRIHEHTRTYTRIQRAYTPARIHVDAHACMSINAPIICTHMHPRIRTLTHAYTRVYTHLGHLNLRRAVVRGLVSRHDLHGNVMHHIDFQSLPTVSGSNTPPAGFAQ